MMVLFDHTVNSQGSVKFIALPCRFGCHREIFPPKRSIRLEAKFLDSEMLVLILSVIQKSSKHKKHRPVWCPVEHGGTFF